MPRKPKADPPINGTGGYRATANSYALKWGVSSRAIVEWKKERAPLDDDDAMVKWFATRKHQPKGVKEWLRRRRNARVKKVAEAVVKKEETAPAPTAAALADRGASAAWKRVASEELSAHAKFKALEKLFEKAKEEGTDTAEAELEVKTARVAWLEVAKAMRALSSAANTEESEQLITKEDAIRILENVGYMMRAGARAAAKVLVIDIQGRPGWKIAEILTTKLWSLFQSSVASLRGDAPGNALPQWAADALLKSMENSARGVKDTHMERAQVMGILHWALDQGKDLNAAVQEAGTWPSPPLVSSLPDPPPPTANDYMI